MKTNLFKSLLVATMAIGAMGGVNSAFAQVTSFPVSANFDDGTKGIFSAGEVVTNTTNIGTVLAAGKGLPITLDFDGDANTDGNQPYTLKENENLTFSYKAYHGYYSDTKKTPFPTTMEVKNSNGVVLVGYTYRHDNCNITDVVINGKTVDGFSAFHAQSSYTNNGNANGFVDPRGKKAYQSKEDYNPIITFSISQSGFVEITFNGREKNLGAKYSKTFSGQLADDVKKDISTLGFTSNVNNSDRYCAIDNFSIKSETKAIQQTSYTIKYVDESSKELKTPVSRSSTVGSNVTATAADMETFYSTDASEKYVYKSGNNEIKLVEDEASNVITLTFSKYTKFGYTINAKENGTDLGEVAKGETYTDGADIAISKFYYINNAWYETTTSPYYINIKPENNSATIEVKKSDITYFAETENLGNITGKVSDKNMSNGAYSAIKGGEIAEICKLPMGEYKVTIYLKANGNRSAIIRDVDNSDNGTNTLCSLPINRSSAAKEYSTTLTLYETTKIGLTGYTTSTGTNQSADLDYIYIQRTGDATETVSVSEAGYATYATTNNVKVPEGNDVKVMTVTVNEGNSTITPHEIPANTVIPAGTGILVKAAAGNHDFVVTSEEGTPLENNNLVAATKAVTPDGAKDFFALTTLNDGKVGFAKVAKDVVIPAGKAYLEVPAGKAKFFGLDSEATGINSVKTAKADGAYYTLEGVKTTKPVKGLYIHNGKKIVVK